MSENSKIEWTDHTFNGWWGCIEVSPACDNCYARTFAKRVGQNVWGPAAETSRRLFGDKHWNEPLKWDREAAVAGVRKRVFSFSMADVFEEHPALDEQRERFWALIEATPNLDWLLLTKRPQNIKRMVPPAWLAEPRFNVWYGTTVENQHYADQRIPILLDVPAAVRFLSMEPLLGPVELPFDNISNLPDLPGDWCPPPRTPTGWYRINDFEPQIHWIITGGESGGHARPGHPDWYRSLRDQCAKAGVAFHFKQWGEYGPDAPDVANARGRYVNVDPGTNGVATPELFQPGHPGYTVMYRVGKKAAGRLLDGREHNEFPESRPAVPA